MKTVALVVMVCLALALTVQARDYEDLDGIEQREAVVDRRSKYSPTPEARLAAKV